MKEYMLIIRVPVTYTPEDAKSVTALWDKVTDKWKTDGIFVTSFVFPSAGFVISEGGLTSGRETVVTNGMKIVSAIVLKASNFEEAIKKAAQAPVLQQKGNIEIAEIMVRPSGPQVIQPA